MDLSEAFLRLKWIGILLGAGLSTLLGGWNIGLKVLVLIVIFDYISGVAAAYYEKVLDSRVGLWGIAKKVLMFMPVALGYWLDQYIGTEILRNAAIWGYIVNEGFSIAENFGRMGIFIPPAFLDALQQLKEKPTLKGGGGN